MRRLSAALSALIPCAVTLGAIAGPAEAGIDALRFLAEVALFLLLWLVLSIIVGVFAHRRGRSGFGWFVFSIFLSPLIGALVVASLRSKNPPARAQEQPV